MPTFHPAALLRDDSKKIDFWKDLKLVIDECNGKFEKN
jgi:uracil-DNA glycosylase